MMDVRRKEGLSVDGATRSSKLKLNAVRNLIKFLPLVLIFLLAINTAFAIDGCYTFYEGGATDYVCNVISETEAQLNCGQNSNCDLTTYFYPGIDCIDQQFDSVCEEIKCSASSDCGGLSKIVCDYQGGIEIPSGEEDTWCTPGCCRTGNFCSPADTKSECLDQAEIQGLSLSDVNYYGGIIGDECTQTYCSIELEKAGLSGYVFDLDGVPLEGATVQLTASIIETTDINGFYSIQNIIPATYDVQAQLATYQTSSSQLTFLQNDQIEINFTLSQGDVIVSISGTITDFDTGNSLSGVSVCRSNPSGGCVNTDDTGAFSFENVPSGSYDFGISKFGYDSIQETLTVSQDVDDFDHSLTMVSFQGLSGTTTKEDDGEIVIGAIIYVNGVHRGTSDGNGEFLISLSDGTYTIYATHSDYQSEEFNVTIYGEEEVENLILSRSMGECSFDQGSPDNQKPVTFLTAIQLIGESSIKLDWDKPCPEVSQYIISRNGEEYASISPLAITWTDYATEWGETYEYSVVAKYSDVEERTSEPVFVSITLGDSVCENVPEGATFCQIEDRDKIFSCDSATNTLYEVEDCSNLDVEGESDWYCTGTSATDAICKDAGACNSYQLLADPFGLYYDSQSCYNPSDNFCYYDYTNSVVDSCESCLEVTSCFDYKSKDACGVNNCLSSECQWIDTASRTTADEMIDLEPLYPVTEETGHGYCVEENYVDDDFCNLCGPDGELFENDFCTAEVCSSLGNCFSANESTLCNECGDEPTISANCHEYITELECTGGQNFNIIDGEKIFSQDQCSWDVCYWDDGLSGGECFKDANSDTADDCAGFDAGELVSCKQDIYPPTTEIISTSTISHITPEIIFYAEDEQTTLKTISFCLDSYLASKCTNFIDVEYPVNKVNYDLEIDLIESEFLQSKLVNGESFLLRYYSTDKYFNQEETNEVFIYVDNEMPDFEIDHFEEINGDIATIDIYLSELNEPMSCVMTAQPLQPYDDPVSITLERDEDKTYTFEDLNSAWIDVIVECVDDAGNTFEKTKTIIVDLEQNIDIISPSIGGAVDSNDITFIAETVVASSCELYRLNSAGLLFEKVADFSTDSLAKHHETSIIPGFDEGEHAGNVKIVCTSVLDGEVLEDYFDFVVDFTAATTIIKLTEGERIVRPIISGWKEHFRDNVQISFECDSIGFDCQTTHYLLGNDCILEDPQTYDEFTSPFNLTNSTEICYYSIDANGLIEAPNQGKIEIDGFGIYLINPAGYTYENELWGVSNLPEFDWQLGTLVDSQSCVFDFQEEFDFENQPLYKQLTSSTEVPNQYIMSPFPGDVIDEFDNNGEVKTLYVMCDDLSGEISSPKKIHIEFDPTAPVIESQFADPSFVVEGVDTTIFALTDDKTLCKFSDNSEDSGSDYFDTMEHTFSDFEDGILKTQHNEKFAFSFSGATKTYNLNVQCMNGAGNLSSVEEITFEVDYSASGNIIETKPLGYSNGSDVVLEVVTNKNAVCRYDGTYMDTTSGTLHLQPLGNLDEEEYQYLISCTIGENHREAELKFTVDKTAPTISSIDDMTQSCSLDEVNLLIYTSEENISAYGYELYKGSSTSSLSNVNSTSEILVESGVLPGEDGTAITGLDLEENETYYVKVYAQDAAGNVGDWKQSNGFIASNGEDPICLLDRNAPSLTIITNMSSCDSISAELICIDELGCSSIKYGTSSSIATCSSVISYYGNKITVDTTSWLCYTVTDAAGNVKNGSKKLTFLDGDGDGISDSCDTCSSTTAGSAVGLDGCAFGQVSNDQQSNDADGDGLPDFWENLYNAVDCEFDPESTDANGDGTLDRDEDYDDDGYTNIQELNLNYDPCLFDEPQSEILSEVVLTEQETSTDKKGDPFAWTFLITGLLFVLGAIGSLIYYYFYTPAGNAILSGISSTASQLQKQKSVPSGSLQKGAKPNLIGQLKDVFRESKERIIKRRKIREREDVFGKFSTKSKEFSHFKDILKSRKPQEKKIVDLVDRYKEHKPEIKAGLKPHEKDLFKKLDNLAKGGSKKSSKSSKIKKISKNDTQDIFKKLKNLSDKRLKK